jgi:hypothetical protein
VAGEGPAQLVATQAERARGAHHVAALGGERAGDGVAIGQERAGRRASGRGVGGVVDRGPDHGGTRMLGERWRKRSVWMFVIESVRAWSSLAFDGDEQRSLGGRFDRSKLRLVGRSRLDAFLG